MTFIGGVFFHDKRRNLILYEKLPIESIVGEF
jgi:hypothetical protein